MRRSGGSRGDAEAALDRYALVLRAHSTHPRAALGAAEARLRLGRDLPAALRELEAVDAAPKSAPPIGDRLRMDLLLARLLAASGRTADAERRLGEAAARAPPLPRHRAVRARAAGTGAWSSRKRAGTARCRPRRLAGWRSPSSRRGARRTHRPSPRRSSVAALAAGKAAAAQGATGPARRFLERAATLGGKAPEAAEARRALASLKRR